MKGKRIRFAVAAALLVAAVLLALDMILMPDQRLWPFAAAAAAFAAGLAAAGRILNGKKAAPAVEAKKTAPPAGAAPQAAGRPAAKPAAAAPAPAAGDAAPRPRHFPDPMEIAERKYGTAVLEALAAEDRREAAARREKLDLGPADVIGIDGWTVRVQTAPVLFSPELYMRQTEATAVPASAEDAPALRLVADGKELAVYRIEPAPGESFKGKFFHMSARIYMQGDRQHPAAMAPCIQIDGFFSDSADPAARMGSAPAYRMEAVFAGGRIAAVRREMLRGMDLVQKGLRYPGIITPGNVRYIGLCPDCGKSFAFRSYNFPMMQEYPAYSDDGMDVCGIPRGFPGAPERAVEIGGRRFWSYNAFRCPRCGAPYVDYHTYPQLMGDGVYALVHLGREVVRFPEDAKQKMYDSITARRKP